MSEYKAVTNDNEVNDTRKVRVKKTDAVVKESILTIGYIDNRIATLNAEIVRRQEEIAELIVVKSFVETEANKVKLKRPLLILKETNHVKSEEET